MKIRLAEKKDCKDIWEWRNHPEVRRWCLDENKIPLQDHKKWFFNKINDAKTEIYIAENENGDKLGQVRFDIRQNRAKINVNLNPVFFDNGLGNRIIAKASKYFLLKHNKINRIRAKILTGNIASIKAFSKAGYKYISEENEGNNRIKIYERSS
ncbi:MAG: GNAT family N-acetyltransferase [Atribacterota bacterium]